MGKLTDYNYSKLKERVKYSLEYTNKEFYEKLENIKGNTMITGVGGSLVVAIFLKKILEQKNNSLCMVEELDQLTNTSPKFFQNLIVVNSSGNNHGVKESLKKDFQNKYLLTASKQQKKEVTLLNYKIREKEESFVAIASTLIPITLLLKYNQGKEYIRKKPNKPLEIKNAPTDWEIFYDEKSKGTALFLESTFIEAGLGNIILHDKYSYCHGRSTLASKRKGQCIYLASKKSDLDTCLLENIPSLYEDIYVLKSKEKESILIDYDLLLQAIQLVYQISNALKRDLSKVKYAKIVPKLYHFKGGM